MGEREEAQGDDADHELPHVHLAEGAMPEILGQEPRPGIAQRLSQEARDLLASSLGEAPGVQNLALHHPDEVRP